MKKIAVILSVYKNDNTHYLRLSFDSILGQEDVDVRLFVGVDGPVGEELTCVLQEYNQYENVQVQWFSTNRGLAAVLNDLLSSCFQQGYEYIARMDADDIARKNRLIKQVEFLDLHPDVDVVGGAINQIDENGQDRNIITRYPLTPEDCYQYFSKRDPVAHPAVLFRKSYFEKAGVYRSEYRKNQDTMLWFDGLRHGCKIANLEDIVLDFRVNENFFSQRRNGYAFAKSLYDDRKKINHELHYGLNARIYALLLFLLRISPVWVKKITYKIL